MDGYEIQITEAVAKELDTLPPEEGSPSLVEGVSLRRMARMQVYLPDDLYAQVKARSLPASELFQKAVRAELRRLELLTETDRYVADLIAEVGPPAAVRRKRAAAVARRLTRRPTHQTP